MKCQCSRNDKKKKKQQSSQHTHMHTLAHTYILHTPTESMTTSPCCLYTLVLFSFYMLLSELGKDKNKSMIC